VTAVTFKEFDFALSSCNCRTDRIEAAVIKPE
jgi:hypothetical protein